MLTTSVHPPAELLDRLVDGGVAARVAGGPRAACVRAARPLVGEITALRESLHVAGMAKVLLVATPEVGALAEGLAGAGARLLVLDGADPVRVADALDGDLEATVLVVAVPPGTAPVDGRALDRVVDEVRAGFRAEGLDPDAHTVVVGTGPGATVTGGAAGAFSAYVLVPAGLAGADVAALVGDAVAARDTLLADDPANPALVLGALLAEHEVVEVGEHWAAALIDAYGGEPVPVVHDGGSGTHQALRIGPGGDVDLPGPVAARILLWEHAAAVAAQLRGPGAPAPSGDRLRPAFTDDDVEVSAGSWLPAGTTTVGEALLALLDAADTHLALHAHLDRESDASIALLRGVLARRTGRTVTFDWGPALRPGAAVCQITGAGDGRSGLDDARAGQADADAAAQPGPVLRLHLPDRLLGMVAVVRAVQHL